LEEKRVESIRDSTNTNTKLKRIAWLSAQAPEMVFDQLMHLVNEGSLAACFHELDGRKAVGIDGIDTFFDCSRHVNGVVLSPVPK
jgi:hypothetical protein